VSCLAVTTVNDNLRQMSVKPIRLYIKAKRKIRDNLAHQEQSTQSPHPHSLFVTLPQILTPLPPKKDTILHHVTREMIHVTKWDLSFFASNTSAVQ